ncbi:MAG: hypothetical protein KDK45_26255, partial [Leptospiraceae bacterium]|nr:hypothetical protein [Leptospiraceae bacterium]
SLSITFFFNPHHFSQLLPLKKTPLASYKRTVTILPLSSSNSNMRRCVSVHDIEAALSLAPCTCSYRRIWKSVFIYFRIWARNLPRKAVTFLAGFIWCMGTLPAQTEDANRTSAFTGNVVYARDVVRNFGYNYQDNI